MLLFYFSDYIACIGPTGSHSLWALIHGPSHSLYHQEEEDSPSPIWNIFLMTLPMLSPALGCLRDSCLTPSPILRWQKSVLRFYSLQQQGERWLRHKLWSWSPGISRWLSYLPNWTRSEGSQVCWEWEVMRRKKWSISRQGKGSSKGPEAGSSLENPMK